MFSSQLIFAALVSNMILIKWEENRKAIREVLGGPNEKQNSKSNIIQSQSVKQKKIWKHH